MTRGISIEPLLDGRVEVRGNGRVRRVDRTFILTRVQHGERGCWEWTGSMGANGRAVICWNKLRVYTSRVVAVLFSGQEVPRGMEVCHHCDNPRCVNPQHLYVGTHRDNMQDMAIRHRAAIPEPLRGMDHPRATLPPEQIREVVAEYLRGGTSRKAIAKKYGVGESTVGRWVRAESRRDSGVVAVVVGRGSRIATGLKPCGTRAAAQQHRKRGETPCDACREADRAYMRGYKAARGRAS